AFAPALMRSRLRKKVVDRLRRLVLLVAAPPRSGKDRTTRRLGFGRVVMRKSRIGARDFQRRLGRLVVPRVQRVRRLRKNIACAASHLVPRGWLGGLPLCYRR